MIQEREKMINIGLWPHQLAGMFQSQQDFWMPLNFFQGGRISGCFVKKSGLTVLNNFYFKGKTKSTSAVRRKYLFCSSSFLNLILFGSFDRNKKRYTGEYVLAGLMYYVNCFHWNRYMIFWKVSMNMMNENHWMMYLNVGDVDSPLPKKWTETCRNGETLKGRGVGKMYFKTLWILIHDYVCLR